MALEIFGKGELKQQFADLQSQIAALENQISSEVTKHFTSFDGKITKLSRGQEELKKHVVKNSGDIIRIGAAAGKNTSIIERQVEIDIPVELGHLQKQINEIDQRIAATKVVLDRMMHILKQMSDPQNRLNQKVMKIEDQLEVMGRVDLIHLVDKLEIVKEQLQKAQENFVPPEITEMLQSLDLKLHRMEKRLEELEDQMIRPIEEVVKH